MKSIRRIIRQVQAMFSGERADAEMEKAYVQYVSGRMFSSFGCSPLWEGC